MYAQVEKPKENKSRAFANSAARKKSNIKQGFGFVDNRSDSITQRKIQAQANYSSSLSIRKKENNTGLTDNIKFGKKNSTIQRLLKRPEGNGTRLYHPIGWLADLGYHIDANENEGAAQGEAGITSARNILSSWLNTDFVRLQGVTTDEMVSMLQEMNGGDRYLESNDEAWDDMWNYLQDYGKVYNLENWGVNPDGATNIPHPSELVVLDNDLGQANENYIPGFVCVLLAMYSSAGGPAVDWDLGNGNRLVNNNLHQWLQARHQAFIADGLYYDQSAFYNRVIPTALRWSGEEPWSRIAELANLVEGEEYLVATAEHMMRVLYNGQGDYTVANYDMNLQRDHNYEDNTIIHLVFNG